MNMNFIQTNDIKFRDFDPVSQTVRYFDLDSYDRNKHDEYGNIQRYICDIDGKPLYEGDIVEWVSGSYTTDGQPDNYKKQAQQSLYEWLKTDRSKDYNYEANGWKMKMSIGVVLFYNGTIGIHNDINTIKHQESFYKASLYYGNLQLSKNYKIIGNVYFNSDLLK